MNDSSLGADRPPAPVSADVAPDEDDETVLDDLFGSVEFSATTNSVLPSGPGTEPALDDSGTPDARLTALNASVPEGVDLVFEWLTVQTDDDEGYGVAAPVPVGWEIEEDSFGVEVDGDDLSFGLDIEFDSGCQGFCTPQDWSQIMDNAGASPFAVSESDEYVLLINQELSDPAGRVMVRENVEEDFFGGKVEIVVARWSNEADHFFDCTVNLPGDVANLWRQFAEACLLADPEWIG